MGGGVTPVGVAQPRPTEPTPVGTTGTLEETLSSYAPILLAAGVGLVVLMMAKK